MNLQLYYTFWFQDLSLLHSFSSSSPLSLPPSPFLPPFFEEQELVSHFIIYTIIDLFVVLVFLFISKYIWDETELRCHWTNQSSIWKKLEAELSL